MPTVFDLKALNTKDREDLIKFFRSQSLAGRNVWKKNTPYCFDDGRPFLFTHDVFQRESRSRPGDVLYEVISNEAALGEGGFGQVKLIERTVAFNKGGEPFRVKVEGKGGKRRVVKIQKHREGIFAAEKESILSPPGCAMKTPVVSELGSTLVSYLTMRRLPGRELFEICNERGTLTIEQRIALSKGLLRALKTQVTERGFIHRDIKPENILVDLDSALMTINIIDFGFAIAWDGHGRACGSINYIAPENMQEGIYKVGHNSDVYSMGRVIALLWNVDFESYDKGLHLRYAPEKKLENLFNGICGLHQTVKGLIKTILTAMLSNKPEERLPLDDAIIAFNRIPDSGTDPVLDDVVAPADGRLLSVAMGGVGFWSRPADIRQPTGGIGCGFI